MLAEFAAASVVFAKAVDKSDGDGDGKGAITTEMFTTHIERILKVSHSKIFNYYLRCLDRCHNNFIWTGPKIQILPRSDDVASILPLTTKGELLDLPSHQIYSIDVDAFKLSPTTPATAQVGQRRLRGNSDINLTNEQSKKRKR